MSFEWFVARRYLTARRKQAFISLISLVSTMGVGVGVMALIIALAIMTGVQSELRDRIVGSTAHIYVYKIGDFDDITAEIERMKGPGVLGVAPAILGPALIRSTVNADPEFVQLKGIDPAREVDVTELPRAMRSGRLDALNRPAGERAGVILGRDLAQSLGVMAGDQVIVITSAGSLVPFAGLGPRTEVLDVVGTFELGFYEFDTMYALVSMPAAERLLQTRGPDLLQLRLADIDAAPAFRARLEQTLGRGYHVRDWTQLNDALYAALWLEKVAISLTIGLIVIVAALQIVASLILLVMEKSRDIAILRTMGAPAGAIRRIFIYQGLTIGCVGTATGTALGLIVCYIADRYQLVELPADVYQITHVPFLVQPLDVAIVVVSAIAVCFLATIYPARSAGRLDPAEALRHQ